jgi:hypothetical protein
LLKELRESRNAMKIIKNAPLAEKMEMVEKGLLECNEPAKRNLENEKLKK